VNAYVDSSVILRLVLNQPNKLAQWSEIDVGVASALVEVECLRTLDRVRLRERIADSEVSLRIEQVYRFLESSDVIEPTRAVLSRAAQPFPTSLGTLDAIHLASALLWRDQTGAALTVATHDGALALAARASGLPVIGI
jgi:uncharacterized protein